MCLAPTKKLCNGIEIPLIGLGTFSLKGRNGIQAIKDAIDCGYRHLDTAYLYGNEAEVGIAIKSKIIEGVLQRKDLFVVTKLCTIFHDPRKVEYACRKSLQSLGLDYIDLYLMHFPIASQYIDDSTVMPKNIKGQPLLLDVDFVETWKAMERLVQLGIVRNIGVSNFNSQQINRILDNCEIKPLVNQVECHTSLNQKKLIKYCKDRGVQVVAHSPFGSMCGEEDRLPFVNDERILSISKKYNKSPFQLALKYLISIGTIPLPRGNTFREIKENIDIFDFELTEEEMEVIGQLNTELRVHSFDEWKNHKYYPFATEF